MTIGLKICKKKGLAHLEQTLEFSDDSWLRGLDLNQRPSGYEPDELPGCSTPRMHDSGSIRVRQTTLRMVLFNRSKLRG